MAVPSAKSSAKTWNARQLKTKQVWKSKASKILIAVTIATLEHLLSLITTKDKQYSFEFWTLAALL